MSLRAVSTCHRLLFVPAKGALCVNNHPFTSLLHRSFASSNQPRFQIPAHVAAFTILLIPTLLFFLYAQRFGPDKDELEQTLRERYGKQETMEQKRAMQEFFKNTILNPNNASADQALREVLRAGKSSSAQETTKRALKNGAIKSTSADDSSSSSKLNASVTDEQVLMKRNEASSDAPLQVAGEQSLKQKRKRQKKQAIAETDSKQADTKATSISVSENTKSALLLTGVAALAAVVGYLAGGGKRQ
ncbi:hypothetical protein MPSEU_000062900 [Mayamaea pseudoterrestris]|nr:hypothetical protein MPSEU_000062900 [Mayamaea pseudoterrestris]